MTTNSSQSQKSAASANKPEPSPNESEPIEPHELAGKMTPEQIGELIERLMKLESPRKE